MKTTLDILLDALRDVVNPDISDLQKNETLDDLGLDSLDYVEICIFLENEIEVDISDVELNGKMTVQQVSDLIDKIKIKQ